MDPADQIFTLARGKEGGRRRNCCRMSHTQPDGEVRLFRLSVQFKAKQKADEAARKAAAAGLKDGKPISEEIFADNQLLF